jgi:hypothetical protein
MSQFIDMDNWEPVDVASTGVGLATGVSGPLGIGFSIFMSGEAGTPPGKDKDKGKDNDNDGQASALSGEAPLQKRTKDPFAKNIFIGMEPPKPSWVRENY